MNVCFEENVIIKKPLFFLDKSIGELGLFLSLILSFAYLISWRMADGKELASIVPLVFDSLFNRGNSLE